MGGEIGRKERKKKEEKKKGKRKKKGEVNKTSDTLLFSFLRKGEGRGEEDRMKKMKLKGKRKTIELGSSIKKGSTVLGLNPVHII